MKAYKTMDETIRELKDNSYKRVFDEPELFCQLIRDFIPVGPLKDIRPEDVEDHTERFLPLTSKSREADTVKIIRMERKNLFVIALIEPQTEVHFLMSFRILEYCVHIWNKYIEDAEREKEGSSAVKEFMLPPILPVVYYSGSGNWTAPVNFIEKVAHPDIFGKYIPDFCYEMIRLKKYTIEELKEFEDALSFIMLFDTIKNPDEIKKVIDKIDAGYIEKIKKNIPEHLWDLISKIIILFLIKMNAPKEEIETVTQYIAERKVTEMFDLMEKYDVQEARRRFREEGIEEGRAEGIERGIERGRKEGKEIGIGTALSVMRDLREHTPPEEIAAKYNISAEKIEEIKNALFQYSL